MRNFARLCMVQMSCAARCIFCVCLSVFCWCMALDSFSIGSSIGLVYPALPCCEIKDQDSSSSGLQVLFGSVRWFWWYVGFHWQFEPLIIQVVPRLDFFGCFTAVSECVFDRLDCFATVSPEFLASPVLYDLVSALTTSSHACRFAIYQNRLLIIVCLRCLSPYLLLRAASLFLVIF